MGMTILESSQKTLLHQNLGTIQPVLDNFSTLHQIWLKFVSCTGEYILTPNNKPQSNFCRLIRAHPEGLKRCRTSARQCVHLNPYQPHLFPCHAGLLILAVPLHCEQDSLGALATGEIRINNTLNEKNKILKSLQDLDLNKEKLLKFYQKIPTKKYKEIMILGEALHTISNCFLKLGIEQGNTVKLHQTTKNYIKEIESSKSESSLTDFPLSWSRQLVQQAVIYILRNFTKPLTLEEVARQVHLSPSYFSHLFSQEQKQTFSNFLIKTRLEKAKELLKQAPSITISELSREIGYEDANYFSRVFKKMTGIPPSLYRKKLIGN